MTQRRLIHKIVGRLASWGVFNRMPDERYIKLIYWARMGSKLNLENPQTFNEKLQWLKLFDRKPEYTRMVDKYEAKKYVADIIGEEYVIPTLGVWDRFEDIDFDALPNQFVLKCTHDSGGLVICRDKSQLDLDAAKKKINRSLRTNFYLHGREWPYKDVNPRIIAEKYMEDSETQELLRDYKFFTFDGVAKALFIASDRQKADEKTKSDFYDMNFKHLPFTNGHPNADIELAKPQRFEEMKRLVEQLSQGIPQLRVDFYEVNGKAYFGDLTFSHWSGLTPFEPEEWDKTLGDWIKLPEANGGGYAVITEGCVLWLHRKTRELTDYKFYCFNGTVKFLYVSSGLEDHSTAKISFVSPDWKQLDFRRNDYCPFPELPPKPHNFEEMKRIAETLSQNFDFLRVDLYEVNRKIYFSELTFSPCNGFMPFEPKEYDEIIGKDLLLHKI